MKVSTTFWSAQVQEFGELLYINGNTNQILFRANLDDLFGTYVFFKSVSKFMNSTKVHHTIDSGYNGDYYQFAVFYEQQVCPLKWFDVIVNEHLTISHDIAFETTLIHQNDVVVPFGKFPMWDKQCNFPKYREFNIKSRAYKYIANQIKESFKY